MGTNARTGTYASLNDDPADAMAPYLDAYFLEFKVNTAVRGCAFARRQWSDPDQFPL